MVKQEVHDGEESRGLLIRERVFFAEFVIDVVKIKVNLFLLDYLRRLLFLLQSKYFGKNLPLILVSGSLFEVFGGILI